MMLGLLLVILATIVPPLMVGVMAAGLSFAVAGLVVARPRFWHQRRENTKIHVKQVSDSDPDGEVAHIRVTFGHGGSIGRIVRAGAEKQRDFDTVGGLGPPWRAETPLMCHCGFLEPAN